MRRKSYDGPKSSVLPTVDGRRWTAVADFSESGPDDSHYVVGIARDGKSVVKFGHGVKGCRPKTGARVTASYRYGAGAAGNRRRRTRYICFSCG